MYGEIITIGDELISGRTLDLNAKYAAGRLTASGLRVTRITSVGDNQVTLSKTLSKALERSRFVIVTGGLGPTDDDMTNEIVASALNRSLSINKQLLQRIEAFLKAKGMALTPAMEKMARLPEGSEILHPDGLMCGCSIIENDVRLYFLPGVPDQMSHLLDNFVLPELLNVYEKAPAIGQRILKLYGINEVEIAEALKELTDDTGNVVLGFYPNFPENHITLCLNEKNEVTLKKELDRIENQIKKLLGFFVFSSGPQEMEEIVGHALLEEGITIAVAESCTGGLIGHRLTNVPGSSAYFRGGVVVYSNQAKTDLLGVKHETLETYGAVSEQTVREMVQGLQERFDSNLGLAVTGIAGPDGGTAEKPVGTVHIGLAAGDEILSSKYQFWGSREHIKTEAALMALDWVRRYLNGNTFLPGV